MAASICSMLTQQQYNSTIKDTCWEDVEDELLAVVIRVLGFEIDV